MKILVNLLKNTRTGLNAWSESVNMEKYQTR